jgi:hypothetical protein
MIRKMLRVIKRAAPVVAAVGGAAITASAQVTNTAAGVGTALTSGVGSTFDTAANIGAAVTGIGLVVGAILVGVRLNKKKVGA